jgi:hypothetical protein
MNNPDCRYFIHSIVVLALCGCGALEHRAGALDHDTVKMQKETAAEGDSASAASTPPEHHFRPQSVNLHIFGFSYHPDRKGSRLNHLDNELNIGLGFGYRLYEDELGIINTEVGVFNDSGSNWAKFAGMCYLFKLDEHWKLGADVLLLQSATYNYGEAFVAPIPRLSYDFGKVIVNTIYVPRYKQLNRFAVYGLYFTIPLWK